jgi:hypothetical protein
MSDFGTMVTIHRTNGENTTPADEDLIKTIANDLAAPSRDRINDFADFSLQLGGSSRYGGSQGVSVSLTDYWVGDDDGNDRLDSEVLIERDRPLAESFGEQLQERLGSEFEVEVYCGDW